MTKRSGGHVGEDLNEQLVWKLVDVYAVVVQVLNGLVSTFEVKTVPEDTGPPIHVTLEVFVEKPSVEIAMPQEGLEA